MPTIFTRIVNGEIPCHKVAESEQFLAFLDISPVSKGHTLVIPKKEVDYIFDMEDDLYLGLHAFAKRVAHAVEKTVHCERIGQTVIGLEVPHAHIHLVPLVNLKFIDFGVRSAMSQEELKELAAKISANFV